MPIKEKLLVYKKMPLWAHDSIPKAFLQKHNTAPGTWARLTILSGKLKFYALNVDGAVEDTFVFSVDDPPPLVSPQAWHKVEPLTNDLKCYMEFLCLPEQYFQKKYHLSGPHSEVEEILKHIQSGKVLDLGCGRGRNSLFLHSKGFDVTAVDKNQSSIDSLDEIIDAENLSDGIHTKVADIQTLEICDLYDLIISTVVFQFLSPDSVKRLIGKMQEHTKHGGFNLIVAPISSRKVPCPIPFPFTFKEGELPEYYRGWGIQKYNEDMGEFHRTDDSGNRYKAQFSTLIAQK